MSEPENARETQISALFDSELDEATRAEVERALAMDPSLAEDLEDFGHLKSAIVADLEHEAAEIPGARFEQVWDEIERGISASSATRTEEVAAPAGFFETFLRGWRAPLMVGAAATCVVGFIVLGSPSDEGGAGMVATAPDAPPSKMAPPVEHPASKEAGAQSTGGTLVSYKPPAVFDGEVEAVEFSGVRGQIVQTTDDEGTPRGLTIWVREIEDDKEEAADGGHRI
jgi:anti-sigma factor RsiW